MYIEAGLQLGKNLAGTLGLTLIAADDKPAFTEDENECVTRYVDRLNKGHQRESEKVEYHEELLPYIQRTIVGFALKQHVKNTDDPAAWKQRVETLVKSWLFDADPMTWIRVREQLRFGGYTGKRTILQRALKKDPLDHAGTETVRILSLVPTYMNTRSKVEIDLTTVSAAVVGIHIPEFNPVGGIFGDDSITEVRVHLDLARRAGIR